jgi:hypothetical protein
MPTLAYQNLPDQPRRKLHTPNWLAMISLLPIPLLASFLFANDRWRGFQIINHYLNRDREHAQGTAWIIVAAMSLLWLVLLSFSRKSLVIWICLALHISMVLFSIFPGGFMIAFLMHWLHGPGA